VYEELLFANAEANALKTNGDGVTTLMHACCLGMDLELVRRQLARGEYQPTALHHAATDGMIAVRRELIVEHNANMVAVDTFGSTPFDSTRDSISAEGRKALLIECYGHKLTQEHGRLALHAVLGDVEYSFIAKWGCEPPLNPLQIRLPLGMLTLQHFRTLLSTLDTDHLIRNRDESGKLPIYIACRTNAPVDALGLILKQDAATLHITDYTGTLRFLVE
jgi:hypothetical protein